MENKFRYITFEKSLTQNTFNMKKIYILTFLFANFLTYGQLSENFDASATLPIGWTAFRGVDNAGDLQDWQINTVRYNSAPNCAYVRYENVAGDVPAQDWLVTPVVDLTNRTGSSLTFFGDQSFAPEWDSVYEVKVSTTSQTDHASFTTVATYGEIDFPYSPSPALATQKTVDLSAYSGQQIYIAFVMTQDDGDNWYIDDVNVTGTLGLADQTGNFKTVVYPNPSTGIFTVQSSESIQSIEVYSILGNKVGNYSNLTIDLSPLSSGTYVAKITSTEGNVSRQKLVKH